MDGLFKKLDDKSYPSFAIRVFLAGFIVLKFNIAVLSLIEQYYDDLNPLYYYASSEVGSILSSQLFMLG